MVEYWLVDQFAPRKFFWMPWPERQRVEEPGVEYRVQWKPEEREHKDKVEVRRKENGEEEKLLGTLMPYTLENTRYD